MVYKLSENIFEFIGNYLLLGLICVVCVLCAPDLYPGLCLAPSILPLFGRYKRPFALVGIAVTSIAWDWLRKQEQACEMTALCECFEED